MNAFLSGLNQTAAIGLAALLNTLWYAAAVVAMMWACLRYWRRANAATRYWIWTAVLGSLLLFPFLPGIAAREPSSAAISATTPVTAAAPLEIPPPPAPVTLTLGGKGGATSWPLWLLAVWIIAAGCQLARLAAGVVSVKRLKARAKAAPPDDLPINLRRPVRLLISDEIGSPAALGYARPAVVVPPELLARLQSRERQDVLLHELAHLARCDDWLNLATRAFRAVLALHPLAPFVLHRIELEREMACDEFVVAHTGSVRSYARSLARLHDLRSVKGARLLASALLGRKVSLADRIESLLRRGREFSARPSMANLAVSAFLLTLLLGAGGLIPAWIAVAKPTLPKSFYDALPKSFYYRPFVSPGNPKHETPGITGSRPGQLKYVDMPLRNVMLDVYDVRVEQIEGLPQWAWRQKYTIEAQDQPGLLGKLRKIVAKLPPEEKTQAQEVFRQNQSQLWQSLLADRFHLRVHWLTKQLPVFEMKVAKGGPKLKPENAADFIAEHRQPGGRAGEFRPGNIEALGYPMAFLAKALSNLSGRMVIDKTGLTGRYDFRLIWKWEFTRSEADATSFAPVPPTWRPRVINPSAQPIETAVLQQLGLELKPATAPVKVLVVDHVEPPTPN